MIILFRLIFGFSLLGFVYLAAIEIQSNKIEIPYFDKFLHFSIFLFLAWLMDRSTEESIFHNKSYIYFLIVYAVGIEVMQFFIPYRSAEFYDLVADLAGMLVYLIFVPRLRT